MTLPFSASNPPISAWNGPCRHAGQLDEDDIRTELVHDSRRGWTGTLERIENRQRRTIYYPSSGKKETVSREELIRRWRASEQSSAFVAKESEDELILEPLEENW